MDAHSPQSPQKLPPHALETLFEILKAQGYSIVGPTVKAGQSPEDSIITYQKIDSVSQLPRGLQEQQAPGYYKLKSTKENTTTANAITNAISGKDSGKASEPFFAHRLGPDSARPWFLPHKQKLWSAKRTKSIEQSDQNNPEAESQDAEKPRQALHYEIFYPPERATRSTEKIAFIGLRACDLKAIAIQDRVFLQDEYQQPIYSAGRENTLIIAVNCTSHASTCFCTSMDCGPAVTTGYDLALTEVYELQSSPDHNTNHNPDQSAEATHYLIAEAGSQSGRALLTTLNNPQASQAELKTAQAAVQANAKSMPKRDFTGVPAAMKFSPEHPQWAAVAEQCLACGNCTMVCPTCFCTTVEDTTDLTGDTAERWLSWDSCFNEGHSYIHGGKVHDDIASRYRQWATHKLSSWHEQFGESGCVGCGRCIAWCPAGIDLRDVASAFVTASLNENATEIQHVDATSPYENK